MSKKVSFIVIGYGFIGRKHAQLIKNNIEAQLVAIVEPEEESRRLAKKDFPSLPLYDSLDTLFENHIESIDFANVCTPNHLHTVQSEIILKKGINVICEKPLGLDYKASQKLLQTCSETQKEVLCVLQNRYSPPIQWLKDVVNKGFLGKIFHLQINCYWNRDDRYYFPNGIKHKWKGTKSKDGGVLYTQFSHFVDILTWVFGEVTNVDHRSSNFMHQKKTDFDDTGTILFNIDNEALGNFNYSTAVWDKNLESSLTVIGEKGSLKIGGQYMDKVVHCHIENYIMPILAESQPPNDYGHFKGSAQNHKYVIQNAIDFKLRNSAIDVSLEEGLTSIKNIELLNNLH